MDTPIIEVDGKKQFIGVEDPNNPPIFIKDPNIRSCKCGHENPSDAVNCSKCGNQIDDGKMQCPVCKKFFEYLVGEDANGGRMGCESDWLPPKKHER